MVKIQNDIDKFLREYDKAVDLALQRMGKDLLRVANIKVPKKSGILRRSGQVEQGTRNHEYYVSFGNDGSKASNYAAVQEQGSRAGAAPFVNYTTPATGSGYLKDAADTVTSKARDYLKQAIDKMGGFSGVPK